MTNEQKERLKGRVEDAFLTERYERAQEMWLTTDGIALDSHHKGWEADEDTILSLIDRVPSEEDVLVEGRALEELSATADKYHELIMSVETKHAGETRHQTALRYIREREIRKALGIKEE